MVAPGNHEASCHEFGDIFCPVPFTNFTAYNYRFRMPAVESGSGTNMWSSFDYGMAHFIMIDTETDVPKAPEGVDTLWHAGARARRPRRGRREDRSAHSLGGGVGRRRLRRPAQVARR
jgi:hypothetical protein